jgi:hypothetical protein
MILLAASSDASDGFFSVAASPNACDGFFFNTALAASSDASCDFYYLLEIKIAV